MKKTILLLALCLSTHIDFAQIINTVAGNGTAGYSGDGGAATSAELYGPVAVTFDATGNMYIADGLNNRVRKVNTSGVITTIAGTGVSGFSGDGGSATSAKLHFPTGLAVDASGNLYIADAGNSCIRKVNTSGIISTFAGIGTSLGFSGDGGAATSALINQPGGIVFDGTGNLYIADVLNNRIRKVNTSGIISTIAGNGTNGFSGDGGAATSAELSYPDGITVDAAGNIYITDSGNNRIRKINTSGNISTFAGNGTGGYSGDGAAATAAEIKVNNYPYVLAANLAIDVLGNLYIPDVNNYRVRIVNTSGIISTIAGNGTVGYSGDGGQATAAKISNLPGVALDAFGSLYIADYSNARIRKVTLPCPANAGPNVTDYKDGGDGSICSAVTIGTPSISGLTYAWSPTTALSCTNCAQPTSTVTATQIYTLTVSGSGCTTATSTVQVTTVVPSLTASIVSTTSVPGSNITATGNYGGNVTPNNYYWSILQTDQWGNPVGGGYSWSGWTAGAPSGPFTFANTSTLTCDAYYQINFAVQNTTVCLNWAPASGVIVHLAVTADAGPNKTRKNSMPCCTQTVVTIGTPSVSGMSYSWSPTTALSCTNCAQPTSSWSNTAQCQVYTLSVSHSGCTTATSTVQVCATAASGSSCCRIANPATTESVSEPSKFNVFPNPSNTQVTLALYNNAEYVRIADITGKVMFEKKDVTDNEFIIDVSKYAKGMYFVIAKIGDKLEKQKLLVE